MKIYLEQIKRNDKFNRKNSGFVKTCNEIVIGFNSTQFTKLMVTEASNQAVLNVKVSNQSSPTLI